MNTNWCTLQQTESKEQQQIMTTTMTTSTSSTTTTTLRSNNNNIRHMNSTNSSPFIRPRMCGRHSDNRWPHQSPPQATTCSRRTLQLALFTLCALVALSSVVVVEVVEAASANRVNMQQVSRQTNQYFLNEFCDLQSKTLRSARKFKQTPDTHSLFLTPKNSLSSVRVLPQKQQAPSSISFGFGSSSSASSGGAAAAGQQVGPILKQLNCSIIVVAPKSHGLLVTVNSIGLPKNLTKLGIILNHDSSHAQHVHLEGEHTSANYLLTQPQSSKIAINLQSFQPIDWSHVSFDILFTVYKRSNGTGGCPNKKWFDCGDNICVPSSLVCDNNRNCPNGNDEMIFYRCLSPLFWSIAASFLMALILIGLIVLVIIIVRKKRAGQLAQLLMNSKVNSFSNNELTTAVENDLMQEHQRVGGLGGGPQQQANNNESYLASNLYLGGFENPVWTNGTLTKQQHHQRHPSTGGGSEAEHQQPTTTAAQIHHNQR